MRVTTLKNTAVSSATMMEFIYWTELAYMSATCMLVNCILLELSSMRITPSGSVILTVKASVGLVERGA